MLSKKLFLKTVGFSLVLGSALGIPQGPAEAVVFVPPTSNDISRQPSIASSGGFTPPNGDAPERTTGGASRNFTPPDGDAPERTTGGASRNFTPPDGDAPARSTSGASRNFAPPDGDAPARGTAGLSRSTFVPPVGGNASNRFGTDGSVRFTPPDGGAPAPRRTASGATRTNIRQVSRHMIALLPEGLYGTTLSSHPTLLVYIPESLAQTAVLRLQDERGSLHHQMEIPISGESGIVTLQLPESAPGLEVGKNYQWTFTLNLESDEWTQVSPFVGGWVKRIAPDAELAETLAGQAPLQQASTLAANGVWYDTASILASLQLDNPTNEDLADEWVELLDSVSLSVPQLKDAEFATPLNSQ